MNAQLQLSYIRTLLILSASIICLHYSLYTVWLIISIFLSNIFAKQEDKKVLFVFESIIVVSFALKILYNINTYTPIQTIILMYLGITYLTYFVLDYMILLNVKLRLDDWCVIGFYLVISIVPSLIIVNRILIDKIARQIPINDNWLAACWVVFIIIIHCTVLVYVLVKWLWLSHNRDNRILQKVLSKVEYIRELFETRILSVFIESKRFREFCEKAMILCGEWHPYVWSFHIVINLLPKVIVLVAFGFDVYNQQLYYFYNTVAILTIPLVVHIMLSLINTWANGVYNYLMDYAEINTIETPADGEKLAIREDIILYWKKPLNIPEEWFIYNYALIIKFRNAYHDYKSRSHPVFISIIHIGYIYYWNKYLNYYDYMSFTVIIWLGRESCRLQYAFPESQIYFKVRLSPQSQCPELIDLFNSVKINGTPHDLVIRINQKEDSQIFLGNQSSKPIFQPDKKYEPIMRNEDITRVITKNNFSFLEDKFSSTWVKQHFLIYSKNFPTQISRKQLMDLYIHLDFVFEDLNLSLPQHGLKKFTLSFLEEQLAQQNITVTVEPTTPILSNPINTNTTVEPTTPILSNPINTNTISSNNLENKRAKMLIKAEPDNDYNPYQPKYPRFSPIFQKSHDTAIATLDNRIEEFKKKAKTWPVNSPSSNKDLLE